ncbi:MAG: ketoacyl-ACP synthase III [Epsilonproteobacteria bacterium]|nr:MAG: ketoacyl-ACP synthase III [Campylobacterota bacterium]
MENSLYSVVVGTGSYLPTQVVRNENFIEHSFYDSAGEKLTSSNEKSVENLEKITDIRERRYVTDELVASDIGFFAARDALESSGIDKESLDYIIVAHNFGDVSATNKRSDFVPGLASRIKQRLEIKNPYSIAYDISFGCPGWLQGVIQANYYLKSGDAKKILVIGTETLSRVSDPHDRDSMIYADGAGAIILEAQPTPKPAGILCHSTRSDTYSHGNLLRMENSYNKDFDGNEIFLKMDGRKLYSYALKTTPQAIKDCIEKAGLSLQDIKKVLIHQANGKMDEAILTRLYDLYNIEDIPKNIMPMTISWLGNSSVATLPTLFDLLMKGKLENHELKKGDNVVFASIGAGMNINAFIYKMP